MEFKYFRLLNLLFLFLAFESFAKNNNYFFIDELLKKFKRPVTLLEIGKNSIKYTPKLALKNNIVCAVILIGNNVEQSIREIEINNFKNVIILNPVNIVWEDIEILGRCEHFDVVIIHDALSLFADQQDAIREFLTLGDNIFFETSWYDFSRLIQFVGKKLTIINYDNGKNLSLYRDKKEGLELARFTQGNQQKRLASSEYKIQSDFENKFFLKKNNEKSLEWIPGINLLTFVMLGGIYPSDKIIRFQLKSMFQKIPYHNDLIVGNMIIQGHKIIPIDFADSRRNANMKQCIDRALWLFNGDKKRLKNPKAKLDEYNLKKIKK